MWNLGSTGLLTLAWFLQKKSKSHEHDEKTYKDYFTKAKNLIQEQYEKHIEDPHGQPWVTINQIRDKLIPEHEQYVFNRIKKKTSFCLNRDRLKHIWERIKNEISKQDSRIRSELQDIDGKKADVWRWIKSAASSPAKTIKSVGNNFFEIKVYLKFFYRKFLIQMKKKVHPPMLV